MDPRLHQGRREARVEALERTYAHKNTTYYVDAANYDHANNKAAATVVDHTLTERTSASVRCRNITDAEETAIALALALGYRQRRSLTVLTDSQAACRNYLQGRISQPALSVIMSHFARSRCPHEVIPRQFRQIRAGGFVSAFLMTMNDEAERMFMAMLKGSAVRATPVVIDALDAWESIDENPHEQAARREELEKEKEMRRAERRAERIQERQERRKMHEDKLQLIREALGFKQ
ncbi:hypothetical protein MRX96_003119 [Rhipicephalus microplus]